MIVNEKIYKPEDDEGVLAFVSRVINEQSNCKPLRIVEQLVEIAVGELKGRPCDISVAVSDKRMKVAICHSGKPINERMVWLMADHTDRVDYHADGDNSWKLLIRRDIPSLSVTRR